MAKKVINSYYEFDPVLGTVSVLGYHKLSDFFLITNVTTNTIIYNFSEKIIWVPNIAANQDHWVCSIFSIRLDK